MSPATSGTMSWREGLPAPGARRVAVRATPDAVRQLRAGDPWLYDRSITSVSHPGQPGDVAVVFDGSRRFVAVGLFDPSSPIRVKLLQARTQATIDAGWFAAVASSAFGRRRSLAADASTTGYRCVHGENDRLPGLVVDRYATTLVVKLYTNAWFPHLASVVDAVLASAVDVDRVVLRLSRGVQRGETFGLFDGQTLVGEPPEGPVLFRERGLAFEADVVSGQKTGHFLDQRDNRTLVRGAARDCDVLDVFAGTGGFALAAAAGGARSTHLVDISAPALETAARNFTHNRDLREIRQCVVHTTVGDAFRVLTERSRRAAGDADRYDIVVLDPPSFASNAASVRRALQAYARLTRLGLGLLRPGGTLVQASCSSRVSADEFFDTVHFAAATAGRPLREIRRTGHASDHPIGFRHGQYLKAIFALA